MLRKLRNLMALGLFLSLAMSALPQTYQNPIAVSSAHAGLWNKVKNSAKSAAKATKRVGRGAKRIAKDQIKGAKVGWKTTKKFFGKGVKIRCCGYGKIGELPRGTEGYAKRDHRKQGKRDHRRLRHRMR